MTTLAEKVAEFPASVPDWQVADTLNTPDGAAYGYRWVDIPCQEIRALLMASGEWIALKVAVRAASEEAVHRAAELLLDVLTLQETLELSQIPYQLVIQQEAELLIQAGILTQATVDSLLLERGRQPLSWALANTVLVDARQVGLARGGK